MALGEDPHLAAVRDAEPSIWLAPPAELVTSTKAASARLFDLVLKYVPKAPLQKLLTDGFDAEQIWQQIEIQDRPVLASIRRQLQQLDGLADKDVFGLKEVLQEEAQETSPSSDESEGDDEENAEEEGLEGEDEFSKEESSDGEEEPGKSTAVEDKFLKMKDMEEFLEDAEGRYERGTEVEDEDEEQDEMDDARSDQEDEDEADEMEQIKYDDFFGKKKQAKKKVVERSDVESDGDREDGPDEEEDGSDEEEMDKVGADEEPQSEEDGRKSTYEKQAEKIKKRIEQLEQANLGPKDWTMRGEVTASRRPKNSALEVDLDFEHNVQPAPMITEEVTASIEDLIRGRIMEGRFDDVQPKRKLPQLPPSEKKEIDETKSTKGLGELYEEEYMQSTGLASAPISESEQLRKEASALFKSLCLKLDALSHFHYVPKPVVEDMEIKENVPALAMEEVAPVSKSEFSMLAPEEVYQATNDLKDEKELTPQERKQRRAAKKRKRSVQQKVIEEQKKLRRTEEGPNEELPKMAVPKGRKSDYVKSAKVFAELDRVKAEGVARKAAKKDETTLKASAFKL